MASGRLSLVSLLALRGAACAAALAVWGCTGKQAAGVLPAPAGRTAAQAPDRNPFVHASGKYLVDGEGRRVVLKGIAFGNGVWSVPAPLPESFHHESDYRRCRSLGVNSIRFYLNHVWFEDSSAPDGFSERGFAWLARNVAWARANGIWMILNLHVPPGGFQSNGGGRSLWTDPENQRKFVRLWREIARRFSDEPAVLGYDLLNEPVVTERIGQWEQLARATVYAIREVDGRHVVVIERVNAIVPEGRHPRSSDWAPDSNLNFFQVDDANVMYEFHFYEPLGFTFQGANWMPWLPPAPERYPGTFVDYDGRVKPFDRGYIERQLAQFLRIQARYGAPLYLGEFGAMRTAFEAGGNAAGYVGDVIDVALEAGIHVNYHSYDDHSFGLAAGDWNQELSDVLAAKYR